MEVKKVTAKLFVEYETTIREGKTEVKNIEMDIPISLSVYSALFQKHD